MTAIRLFNPAPQPEPAGTVAALIAAYLAARQADVAAGLLTAVALEKAQRYCLSFARDFGEQALAECKRGDLRRFLSLHPEYAAPHTKHDATGSVVTCFNWLVDPLGLIGSSPYAKPKDLPTPEPREPIRPEEVRRMLAVARYHGKGHRRPREAFRLLLWFLWETGCRTCEARELCWEHYDDERGLFELPGKTTRRTGRKRLIVLGRRAWRLVRWLRRLVTSAGAAVPVAPGVLTAPAPAGHVFVNGLGKPWTKDRLVKTFRQYADLAGVRPEVSGYCCRHGFCCERLEAGVGERQVADLLGHSSTRLVGYYGRAVKAKVDYLRDSLEKRKD